MHVCPTCFRLMGGRETACPEDGAAPTEYSKALIGQDLGHWRVQSKIGEGGMAIVYVAEHETLGRKAALKVLHPELSLRDTVVERFVQEARSVNTIGHPNIVNVYDFGRAPGGSPYIVMEYLEGETLRELIEREGTLRLDQICFVVEQVGQALSAAHTKGFVHRDVKPENIMICGRAGRPLIKLLDFGITKLLDTAEGHTQTGSVMGTAQYMAPEQLDGAPVDQHADVYGLGAVTYHMVAGRVPYDASSQAGVRQQQLSQPAAAPSTFREPGQIPAKLDQVILQALAPTPQERFHQIQELVQALLAASQYGGGTRAVWVAVSTRRAQLALIIAAGLVALMATLGLLLWLGGGNKDAPHPRMTASGTVGPSTSEAPAAAPADHSKVDKRDARQRVIDTLRSQQASARARVAQYLGRLPRTTLEADLRGTLGDPDPRVRQAAARALGELPEADTSTREALRRALSRYGRSGGNPWLRVDIATALALVGDPAGVAQLRRELKHPNRLLRNKVLEALARVGDPAGAQLKQQLKRSTLPTRMRRLGYLASRGNGSTSSWARSQLKRSMSAPAWEERILAAAALASYAPKAARSVLVAALRRAPRDIRLTAALTLATSLQDPEGGALLLESLLSVNERRSVDIALGLGHLEGVAIEAGLTRALHHGPQHVRLAAAVALLER